MSQYHNAPEVLKWSRALHKRMELATRNSTNRAARHVRDAIRDEIPPPKGAGAFPGYKARGTLKRAVVTVGPKKSRDGWQADVVINRNSRAAVYARIHEVGGVIYARRAPWLIFRKPPVMTRSGIPGNKAFVFRGRDGREYVATKAVRIRRKRYFATGWRKGLRTLPQRFWRDWTREIRVR